MIHRAANAPEMKLFKLNDYIVEGFRGDDNQDWISLKDLCEILGVSDSSNVAERLDVDEKKMATLFHESNQNRGIWFVNEPGVYRVIFMSTTPTAKRLTRWVTREVLPALFKTGQYEVNPEQLPQMLLVEIPGGSGQQG